MKFTFRFESSGEEVELEGESQLNVLAHAQIAERSLRSQCGGQCECGTCRVIVLSGTLSPMRHSERELLTQVGVPVDGSVRLACQAFVDQGDCTVLVPAKLSKD